MSKNIVECVHWDPEVDHVQAAGRKRNGWLILVLGTVAVVVVASVTCLLLFGLPGRQSGGTSSGPGEATVLAEQPQEPPTDPPYVPQTTTAEPAQSGQDPYLTQGIASYDIKNYAEAIGFLSVALQSNPALGPAYTYRGLSYFSQADYARAVADFTQSLRYTGESAEIYTLRGTSYVQLRYYTEAIADLTRAIVIDPAAQKAYTYRAVAYESVGSYDLAAADRQMAGALGG
jgi:tetratricopeptide (TPR) repeat protein